MEYSVLTKAGDPLLAQAVKLHIDALSYRSTITVFGERFLAELYDALLDDAIGFVVVAHEGPRLCGFVLACVDSTRMMGVVPRRWRRFARIMLRVLLTRPALWPRIAETLFYSRKESVAVRAELVVIAVVAELRSAGVGKKMLSVLDRELTSRGIDEYKVTVHQAMAESNRFYVQNGFRLESTFSMYGVPWNLYVQRIAQEARA